MCLAGSASFRPHATRRAASPVKMYRSPMLNKNLSSISHSVNNVVYLTLRHGVQRASAPANTSSEVHIDPKVDTDSPGGDQIHADP